MLGRDFNKLWAPAVFIALSLLSCQDKRSGNKGQTPPQQTLEEELVHKLVHPDAKVREDAKTNILRIGPRIGPLLMSAPYRKANKRVWGEVEKILQELSKQAATPVDLIFPPYRLPTAKPDPLLVIIFDEAAELEVACQMAEGWRAPYTVPPVDFERFRFLSAKPQTIETKRMEYRLGPVDYHAKINWDNRRILIDVVLTRVQGYLETLADPNPLLLPRVDDFGIVVKASFRESTSVEDIPPGCPRDSIVLNTGFGLSSKIADLSQESLTIILNEAISKQNTLLLRAIAKTWGTWQEGSLRSSIERVLDLDDPLVHLWLFRTMMQHDAQTGVEKIREYLSVHGREHGILRDLSVLAAYDAVARYGGKEAKGFLLDDDLYKSLRRVLDEWGSYSRSWLPFFIAKNVSAELPDIFARVKNLESLTNEAIMLMELAACSKDPKGMDALATLLDSPDKTLRDEALPLVRRWLSTPLLEESPEELRAWWKANRSRVYWRGVQFHARPDGL